MIAAIASLGGADDRPRGRPRLGAAAHPSGWTTARRRDRPVLPQTQCERCGYPGCRPYAEAVASGTAINRCPPGGAATIDALAALLDRPAIPLDPELPSMDPNGIAFIDESRCIGCALCLPACPVDAIVGASGQCTPSSSADCTGCELCLPVCPVDCITMETSQTVEHGRPRPRKCMAPPVRRTHPTSRGTSARGRGAPSATPVANRRTTQLGRRVIRPRTTSAARRPFARADSRGSVQTTLFGVGTITNVVVALLAAVAVEAGVARLRGQSPIGLLRDGSACITASLIALSLPPGVPFAVVIGAVVVAIAIAKHAFGGAGNNPFNPAMVGYAAILLCVPPSARLAGPSAVDAVTAPTALDAFKHRGGQTVADVWTRARGFGALGGANWEWLNAAYLAGGITLVALRVVDWRIPLTILATVCVLAPPHTTAAVRRASARRCSIASAAARCSALFRRNRSNDLPNECTWPRVLCDRDRRRVVRDPHDLDLPRWNRLRRAHRKCRGAAARPHRRASIERGASPMTAHFASGSSASSSRRCWRASTR